MFLALGHTMRCCEVGEKFQWNYGMIRVLPFEPAALAGERAELNKE